MSAPNLPIALRPAAERDLRGILLSTAEEWGEAQRDAYRARIEEALETIGAHPHIGKTRHNLGRGLRSYPVQQHVIYYRIGADSVTVLRILHSRMDAARHLRP